jgi:chromosomal replication initiator protein
LVGSLVKQLTSASGFSHSPLVLFGPSGVGKSHLAQIIASAHGHAVYVHGADFACELAMAVNKRTTADFCNRYRTAAMLVLDDLSQLMGRPIALAELQHTLDALEACGSPVVITSSRPPQEMAELPPALCSRLSGGLLLKISPPGSAARQEILSRVAAVREITLPASAAKLLAEALQVGAGELCGHLAKLEMKLRAADPSRAGITIEPEVAKRYLAHYHTQQRPSLKQVTAAVARYYGLQPAAMGSTSRRRQLVLARAMAIYLGRTMCGASLTTLGKHFGGRDHTTALHSFRQLQRQLSCDAELSASLENLRQSLARRAS